MSRLCNGPTCFHPFQGRPLFGLVGPDGRVYPVVRGFHPFQGRPLFGRGRNIGRWPCGHGRVSIPFREDLYSDQKRIRLINRIRYCSFHPFQGRPLFGLIRQVDPESEDVKGFHPFQGRPSFGHENYKAQIANLEEQVSIPFREDLHSDVYVTLTRRLTMKYVSIPFREDLHSDLVYRSFS